MLAKIALNPFQTFLALLAGLRIQPSSGGGSAPAEVIWQPSKDADTRAALHPSKAFALSLVAFHTNLAIAFKPCSLRVCSSTGSSICNTAPRRCRTKLAPLLSVAAGHGIASDVGIPKEPRTPEARRLEKQLFKQMRQTCRDYNMVEGGDHIMVCVSGGKDSATLLHLFMRLQRKLGHSVPFKLTAVHLDQQQPGYDNTALVAWLEELGVPHLIVSKDTYSIVKDKTPENKAYCSMCSRLRRGILYTVASNIGATKLALGHHANDAAETLFLNLIHQGQLSGIPARYYSDARDAHVMRPLITCLEEDIAAFATMMKFPILPCNLCGSQPDLQRGKVKLLLSTLESLNPQSTINVLNGMSRVQPTHLLDQQLRAASGFDPITGQVRHTRAATIRGYEDKQAVPDSNFSDMDSLNNDPLLLL